MAADCVAAHSLVAADCLMAFSLVANDKNDAPWLFLEDNVKMVAAAIGGRLD